jgi:hypothetical protein
MPDITGAEYMVDYWQTLGRCSSGGMGPVPLSATELRSWQEGTLTEIDSWEFSTLIEMSRGYVSSLLEGEKPETPPPYGDPVREFDRESVSKKVTNAFKAFLQARKN